MNRLSVDFHTHILPCIDDGSTSLSKTVQMLKLQKDMGIETVIATPHFYANIDNFDDFITRRHEALKLVKGVSEKQLPKIVSGAEVLYFEGMQYWDILPQLAIEGTKYILIELSHSPLSKKTLKTLAGFKSKTGYTPIIAHLDRYITAFRTYKLPEILSEMDVLVQMNASFLLEFPSNLMALKLLKTNKVHLLGSDCHNLTSRAPNLDRAQEVIIKKAGQQKLNQLIEFQNLVIGG